MCNIDVLIFKHKLLAKKRRVYFAFLHFGGIFQLFVQIITFLKKSICALYFCGNVFYAAEKIRHKLCEFFIFVFLEDL